MGDCGEKLITPEALENFIAVASSTPLPICILRPNGFVHFTNKEFEALVHIPFTHDFPFVGRFLEASSSVDVRRSLEKLVESPQRTSLEVDCIWTSANIVDESVNNHYTWQITGFGDSRVFVLSGR